MGKAPLQIGCWIRSAHLVAPAAQGTTNYDLNALALLMRDWASDPLLAGQPLVTCLIAENLNDLHPLLANNPRAAAIKISLPAADELQSFLKLVAGKYATALKIIWNIDGAAGGFIGGHDFERD